MRAPLRTAAVLCAASVLFALGGCQETQTVSRDVRLKKGVTVEDDLIHFYGAPSQRIIRGESEYFVYNGRTMNVTSSDGSQCRGTPVFIFSYDDKKLSDLKCRENIPADELSSQAGDSIVVGVKDSSGTPLYDASSPETDNTGDTDGGLQLAPSEGMHGAEGPAYATAEDGTSLSPLSAGDGSDGSRGTDGGAGSTEGGDASDIPLEGSDGEMEIINR